MKPMFIDPPPVFAGRSGKLLVLTQGAPLPNACIRCGGVPAEKPIKKRFAWHHPALYLLIILGVLLYAIVAVVVQKKMDLQLPVCEEHASQYRSRRRWAILLLVGAIPLFIVLAIVAEGYIGWWILLLFVMLIAGAVFLSRTNLLQPKKITETHGFFTGAGEEFLGHLEEAPVKM